MSDLPKTIEIHEEGPREGFQIEKGNISSADKIALIDALSLTGVKRIQAASFVNPKLVPSWADAEIVVGGFTPAPKVAYSALWFNEAGLKRALTFRDKLTLKGSISLSASEAFSRQNLNRDRAGQIEAMRRQTSVHLAAGVPVIRIGIMAAFGCNFSGDISPAQVIATVRDGLDIATAAVVTINELSLADTMGWATPARVERLIGEVRSRWPELELSLHLHDTRGLGIANALAALEAGVDRVDGTVGGLGGCPFAPGASGNLALEDLVHVLEESGVDTGIDLEALIDVAHLACGLAGRPVDSHLAKAGRRFIALAEVPR